MKTKTDIITDVREFSRKFKAVIDLADALEPIANLELAQNELKAQVEKLVAQRDALASTNAADAASARAAAEDIVAKAKAEAEQTVAKAKAQADKIVDEAKDKQSKAEARAKAADKKAEAEVAAAGKVVQDLQAYADTLRAELADVTKALEAARAQARALLGG